METNKEAASDAAQEVWQVIRAFNQAFADNDPEQYFQYIDEDITVLTPGNPYRVAGIARRSPGVRVRYPAGLQPGGILPGAAA